MNERHSKQGLTMKCKNHPFIYLLIIILGAIFLNGCADSSTNTQVYEKVAGTYSIIGEKIVTTYSEWPIPENEEPTVDTLGVDFLLVITAAENREDTIRLIGVEGVDIGEGDNRVFPNCTVPDECEFFGTLVGEDLEISVSKNGRSYQAIGSIYQTYDPYLEMTAVFNYQNITIEYEVEGGLLSE